MRRTALLVFVAALLAPGQAFSQEPVAPPAPAAPPAPPAPEAQPVAPEAVPAGSAPLPAVMPPYSEPPAPAPAPAATTQTPPSRPTGTAFALELGAALDGTARFPKYDTGRGVEEVVDSAVGLGAWVGSRSAIYGLTVERVGFGKDHYGTSPSGETLNATYLADTLWLAGRWYLRDTRPAFFISVAAGPALPRVRATGTRASNDVLVVPPEPYECSVGGRVGAAVAASAGGEFDVAESWSFLGEARLSGHFLSGAADAFSGCGPGTGTAVSGALRLGVAYRFGR